MTTNESLPSQPRDARFSWARDLSTGRLHVANGSACYCNARYRVTPVASPEGASEFCPTCVALAVSTPPPFATR